MDIVSIRAEGQAPQFIGRYDGLSDLKALLANGRAARHPMKIAAVATRGNRAACYTFTTFTDYQRFFKLNADLHITDRAIG